MFKRSEKKIKAVFKMQFQVTQVPQMKAKGLMISLVPVDVGKPTVRLPKASISKGACLWENPVYEAVKLVKEIKTGRIREKFYYLIVSTGSSKSGFLGEVSVDFADLAEVNKPLKLILPLQTSKSGAILHVTVQRIQGDPNSRCVEDDLSSVNDSDECLDTELNDCYSEETRTIHSSESEGSSEATSHEQNGSLGEAESDNSDNKSVNGMIRTSYVKSGHLKNQMKMLERKAEVAEMEAQSLRQQIIKESKKGQKLSEQMVCFKQDRDALKAECEQLKSSSKCKNVENESFYVQKETANMRKSLENVKQELENEKGLNKKMKLQLQKTEDSNSEFVLTLRDLNKELEQKNMKINQLSNDIKALQNASRGLAAVPEKKMENEDMKALEYLVNNLGNDAEIQRLKQDVENLVFELEMEKKEKAEIRIDLESLKLDYECLETEHKEIYSTLQENKKEKMEPLVSVKRLKLQVASLEEEVKSQELQYSRSLNAINELEMQVENLQKELENQAQAFEEDLDAVSQARIMQEQRAIRAEEAFRKTRWNNANAAERLQEEFKRLSADMSSKIEENEKLAQISIAETNDLRCRNEVLEDLLQKARDEHQRKRDEYEKTLHELQEQKKRTPVKENEGSEKEVASGRKGADEIIQENISLKSQIDQAKSKEENLQLELKKMTQKNSEVKNNLLKVESEKENLKTEVSKLQIDLHNEKEEKAALQNSIRSPVKAKNRMRSTAEDEESNTQTNLTDLLEQAFAPAKDINDRLVEVINEGIDILPMTGKLGTKHIKRRATHQTMLEPKSDHLSGSCDTSNLLSEVVSLREKNISMEERLKEMHERYSEVSLRFAEVEGERQQLVMTLRNLKNGKKN